MVKRIVAIVVIVLGIVNIALGITFITIGQTKANYLHQAMDEERITLGLSDEQIASGEYVDNATEAQIAGDTVRSHRHEMGTYDEALGGGRFDPTKPEQLIYSQALNLENYLYLAVASFGLTTVAIGAGAGLLVAGVATVIVGVSLFFWRRRSRLEAGSLPLL